VLVLLVSTGAGTICLGCEETKGDEASCCSVVPAATEDQGGCCHPGLQPRPQADLEFRQDCGGDPCGCVIVPLGFELAQYVIDLPSTPGSPGDPSLDAPVSSPVDPILRAGKVALDDTLFPPLDVGILGTVVLQL